MNARDFAERALLGVLLTEQDTPELCGRVGELAAWLRPEDFHRPMHQTIYRVLRDVLTDTSQEPTSDHDQRQPKRYAVTVYDRIQLSGELGAIAITAPEPVTLMVVEASIRRDLAREGVHVAQVAESADLTHILDTVDKALDAVEHAHQRWKHLVLPPATRPRLLVDPPALPAQRAAAATGRPELVERPSEERLSRVEHDLVRSVLAGHGPLDDLVGRVLPEDFSDPRASASYRAAGHPGHGPAANLVL